MPFTMMYGNPFVPGMGQDMRQGARRKEDFARMVQNAQLELQDRRVQAEEARLALAGKKNKLARKRADREIQLQERQLRQRAYEFEKTHGLARDQYRLGVAGQMAEAVEARRGSRADPAEIIEERNKLRSWGFEQRDPEAAQEYRDLARRRDRLATGLKKGAFEDTALDRKVRENMESELVEVKEKIKAMGSRAGGLLGAGEMPYRALDGTVWVGARSAAVNEGREPSGEGYTAQTKEQMKQISSRLHDVNEERLRVVDAGNEVAASLESLTGSVQISPNNDELVQQIEELETRAAALQSQRERLEAEAEILEGAQNVLRTGGAGDDVLTRARQMISGLGVPGGGEPGEDEAIPEVPQTAAAALNKLFSRKEKD